MTATGPEPRAEAGGAEPPVQVMWAEPEDFRLLGRLVATELAIQRSIRFHHALARGEGRAFYDSRMSLEQRDALIGRLDALFQRLPGPPLAEVAPPWARAARRQS